MGIDLGVGGMHDRFNFAPVARSTLLSIGGFAVFLALTGLVHARLLAGVDLATTSAMLALASAPLDAVGTVLSVLFSAEISLILALLMGLFLWRQGCGPWSLAPFALLLVVGIELGMKLIIDQPPVPMEFHRMIYYPLTSVDLSGSFPSGHAARAGFLCAFLAVMVSLRGGAVSRLSLGGLALVVSLVGFTRVYLGDHWLSDVVAGLVFGGSLALMIAPLAMRRLRPF